jgi:hypothetical protein
MTEKECEIKRLESEIDEIFKMSRLFKNECVSSKSIFDIERLRERIKSKAEGFRAIHIFVLMVSVVFPYLLNSIFTKFYLLIGLIIYIPILFFTFRAIDKKYRKGVEIDTYVVGLISMLIDRKKELENKTKIKQEVN